MPRCFGPLIDQPSWVAALPVKAGTTASMDQGCYQSYSMTGFASQQVIQANRLQLMHGLGLNQSLFWLQQSHSAIITSHMDQPVADGAVTSAPGLGLVVQTADCMPILLYDAYRHQVYALHVGWRGLFSGIIRKTLAQSLIEPRFAYAWIGPSISHAHYQVGPQFADQFYRAGYREAGFFDQRSDGVYADLQAMARHDLASLGVMTIACSAYCTYRESYCFSHRRSMHQGAYQGRMASFIVLDSS